MVKLLAGASGGMQMARTKQKLVIIGAGGHGKVVGEIAMLSGDYDEIVYLDNDTGLTSCLSYPVVGPTADWRLFGDDVKFFVAIGGNLTRQKMSEEIGLDRLVTLVHPGASVSSSAVLGRGCLVTAQSHIGVEAKIGDGCIVNTGATIDHECAISDFVHLGPGSNLGGQVRVGLRSWIAINAAVINNIDVTNDVIVGAGGMVVRDIAQSGTYVGVPVSLVQKKPVGVRND